MEEALRQFQDQLGGQPLPPGFDVFMGDRNWTWNGCRNCARSDQGMLGARGDRFVVLMTDSICL
jgi:hypothetical protein